MFGADFLLVFLLGAAIVVIIGLPIALILLGLRELWAAIPVWAKLLYYGLLTLLLIWLSSNWESVRQLLQSS
jgi:hypothetical protein